MRKQARITSKGQITVPREIRRELGVRPGDNLLFENDGSGVRVRPVEVQTSEADVCASPGHKPLWRT